MGSGGLKNNPLNPICNVSDFWYFLSGGETSQFLKQKKKKTPIYGGSISKKAVNYQSCDCLARKDDGGVACFADLSIFMGLGIEAYMTTKKPSLLVIVKMLP